LHQRENDREAANNAEQDKVGSGVRLRIVFANDQVNADAEQ
jgi:hypothetical protein